MGKLTVYHAYHRRFQKQKDNLPEHAMCQTVRAKQWMGFFAGQSDITLYQHEDPDIGRAMEWVKEGRRPQREEVISMGPAMGKLWNKFDQLSLVDGTLTVPKRARGR